MGSDLACPCTRQDIESEEIQETPDVMKQVMNGKLNENDIILEFHDDQTKVCLIKTINIEQFFNNRDLVRMNSKKEQMKYYNSVFITNYLARSKYSLVILQDSPYKYKQNVVNNNNNNNNNINNTNNNNFNPLNSSSSSFNPGNNFVLDCSGKYSVDNINLVSSYPDQVIEQLLHNFNTKLKKNYQFIGIINDFPYNNRQFHVLSRLGYSKDDIAGYSINVFCNEGKDITQKDIEDIINSNENCFKRLKAIMVDFVQYTEEEMTKEFKKKQIQSKIKHNMDSMKNEVYKSKNKEYLFLFMRLLVCYLYNYYCY